MSNNIPQFIGDANSWERFTKAGLFEFLGEHSTCYFTCNSNNNPSYTVCLNL